MRELPYRSDDLNSPLEIEEHDDGAVVRVDDARVEIEAIAIDERYVTLTIGGKRHPVLYHASRGHVHVAFGGSSLELVPVEEAAAATSAAGTFTPKVTSPMPGKILDVFVSAGEEVEADTPLLLLEAMKMENTLRAPTAARVVAVDVAIGDMVRPGDTLLLLEEL